MTGTDATPVDAHFGERVLAELYDAFNPWGPSDDFYAALAARAASVLDVGCGTGLWLRGLRRFGQRGDLWGVDPAAAMLAVAKRDDVGVEWRLGDVRHLDLDRRFELAVMTGHAFQVLLTDEDVLAALTCVRAHLEPGLGRFAFETRNPAAREWERWSSPEPYEALDDAGNRVLCRYMVDGLERPDLVRFHATFRCDVWPAPIRSDSTLRFIEPERLGELLSASGFTVESWLGDWTGVPVDDDAPEIIVVARAA